MTKTPEDTAAYMVPMLEELERIAIEARLDVLAYVLGMAVEEAKNKIRRDRRSGNSS